MADTQLHVSKKTLIQTVTALDTSFEQSVEKDFVLPDYCPDVFRILKCKVCPRVVSQSINGDRLTIDTDAVIRVLYLSENSGRINLLEHKLSFSKTLDLGNCTGPIVRSDARLDYVNCRVVNQRRVDIRGAYTVRVKVTGECRKNFITDADGCGIQLKKIQTAYPAQRLTASKRITVIEELELGGAKPPVGAVLMSECRIERKEEKIIQGKLITKGDADIEMVYTPAEDSGGTVETMRFSLPFSQVIDIDGIDESFEVGIENVSACCNIMPRAEDANRLECELMMLINCTAVRYESCDAVTDAFSTLYPCETSAADCGMVGTPKRYEETFTASGVLGYSDGELGSLCSVRCEADNISVRSGEDRSVISGSLIISALGTNSDGAAVYLENESPFEFTAEGVSITEADVNVRSCSYHLTNENTAEVKAEVSVCSTVSEDRPISPLGDITVDTSEQIKCSGRCAVKLCRVEAGEDLWEIAKRCRTSMTAIIEENELTSDKTEESGMLLIPLIN